MKKFKTMFGGKRSSKQVDPPGQTTNQYIYAAQASDRQPGQNLTPNPYVSGPSASKNYVAASSQHQQHQQYQQHHPHPPTQPATHHHQIQQQQQYQQHQHPSPPAAVPISSAAATTPLQSSPIPAVDEPYSFTLKLERGLWPPLELEDAAESLLPAAGKLHLDFTERLATAWANSHDVGGSFGTALFSASPASGVVQLPALLFDLSQYRVVRSADVGRVRYAAISHVWGQTTNIDGSRYGVGWSIPIQSETRLLQILEAARVVIGERYVWIDVLCLDQRLRNEVEIAQMKSYFANATGCFVWLDNTFGDPGWEMVLNAIEHINAMYKQDKHGTPYPEALQEVVGGGSLFNLKLSEQDCISWIRRMAAISNAPWFRRVWTLQEGVIPDSVYFCTPERYMFSGASMWQLSGVIEMLSRSLIKGGALLGTGFAHDLQRSEVHKMLKLRQLYRSGGISYWHLAQAVQTRHCKFEQDRVLGILGLVNKALPTVTYHRTVDELYQELYRVHLADGDFRACMFLGGQSQLPVNHESIGMITPELRSREESHTLEPTSNGLHLNNVGYDYVTRMHCHFGTGSLEEWPMKFNQILDWTVQQQQELAMAFNMPDDVHEQTGLCAGALAAYTAITGRNISPESMHELAELWETVQRNEPIALLEWIRVGALLLRDLSFDSALVLLVTQSRNAQLAILTEQVDDLTSLITLMPASYQDQPGAGCIVGRLLPSGQVKKVGLGFGRGLRYSGIARFTLVD
ncbi:heterokaryon incompatibility protein (HET) domain-containing protein [Pochonia chlamydosporia 170]|uniref:Heterokaryon incompatibility protein (HET) domain-containing protein n=1 Tax=Pochonia chlamydosporia 170 TaxID=1380566 RepID=A0A179FAM6_METCM|nr:heterokaryon incompatibility protein (HET) domain-containing protein [Pochonia chlamydosporia 170]OAQ62341.1 heterokaryon incompatibility protein (HET) domain-containing protein [Pochonia chlamydosporia 170]